MSAVPNIPNVIDDNLCNLDDDGQYNLSTSAISGALLYHSRHRVKVRPCWLTRDVDPSVEQLTAWSGLGFSSTT